jgi:phospholipid-binding lipoprotein MlaA
MRAGPFPAAILAATLMAGGCAHQPADDPADPLEPVNRAVYGFNETADRYVLRPVAKGYEAALPSFVRTGVRNFFDNLFYPTVIVNDLLQLKGEQLAQDFCRFVLNSTFGLGGLLDIAGPGGLQRHDEDFGQTLGYWGVGEGWYLMLPLFGPTNNRDLVGRIGDSGTSPLFYLDSAAWSYGLGALDVVADRAELLKADRLMAQQLDRYVFVRTIYLQHRQNRVYDGSPPKEEYDFEADFEDDAPADAPAEEPAATPES